MYDILVRKWYFDELYRGAVVGSTLGLARGLGWFDRRGVDAVVVGLARLVERLGRVEAGFDRLAVDRVVGLVASAIYGAGDRARRLQSGNIRAYLMTLALTVLGLIAALLAWAWPGFRGA